MEKEVTMKTMDLVFFQCVISSKYLELCLKFTSKSYILLILSTDDCLVTHIMKSVLDTSVLRKFI